MQLNIDFTTPQILRRIHQISAKNELLARAVGVKNKPVVLDATAGLGRDSFILAALGCEVIMVERNMVVKELLNQALIKAQLHPKTATIAQRMKLANFSDILDGCDVYSDVVYLDPMFPESKKSALVKKELQILRKLVGLQSDVEIKQMIEKGLEIANKVVLKRPKNADFFLKPNLFFKNESIRFDIYLRA